MRPPRNCQPEDGVVAFDNILTLCDESRSRYQTVEQQTNKKPKELHSRIANILIKLSNNLGIYENQVSQLNEIAPLYDSKTKVKANGFRSFISIAHRFTNILTDHLVAFGNIKNNRALLEKDVEKIRYISNVLEQLIEINKYLFEIHEIRSKGDGELFPSNPDIKADGFEDLSQRVATLDLVLFYGPITGFHMKGDCRNLARPLLIALASFSDFFAGTYGSKLKRSLSGLLGIRYTMNHELLSRKIYEECKARPVEFCKTFFNMSEMEIMNRNVFSFMGDNIHLKANCVFKIPPEKMSIMNTQGAAFQVPIPSSHLGSSLSLQVRLLSPFRTPEMIGACSFCGLNWISKKCSCQIVPVSDCIIFHVHGGGFVAQTSKSHEIYLKRWAKHLGIPILSVDYSLAPEAPYPRATEEVLFAYCWMRNNFSLLGTSGRKVLAVGDSAGGNLLAGLIMQCIQYSLPKPDFYMGVYPSYLSQNYPSPSRLVSLFDPLVMFPCLLRCLNAYADPNYSKTCPRTFIEELEASKSYNDPLLSPLLATKDMLSGFPTTFLITSDIDPCLDEAVAFSNKLVDAGVEINIEVLKGLPHGFLSLIAASKDCKKAVDYIGDKLTEVILT